jgi:uncharacterized SAM-binding protein YcdF (DUF218 family)
VLGGGVIKSEISADRGEIALGDTADRIIAAVELARRYPSAHVVFTGRKEADFVIRFFEKLDVPRDRIIVEGKSRNTTENAAFTKQLVMAQAGRAVAFGDVCNAYGASGRGFPKSRLWR